MSYTLSANELRDAIERANLTTDPETGAVVPCADVDGTYALEPTWLGSVRVWMARRITEASGFEIAYAPVGDDPIEWRPGLRIGVWTDSGRTQLDYTLHVDCPADIAITLGARYCQDAIWEWNGDNGAAIWVVPRLSHTEACEARALEMAHENGAQDLETAYVWLGIWDSDGGRANYGACTCDRTDTYLHFPTDNGAPTLVHVDADGTRWHYIGETSRRMILPVLPTPGVAGRYFADAIAAGEYSDARMHDDYMLEGRI